jgi:hypothetical protein
LSFICKSNCASASPKLGFKFLVTSLLLVTIHTNKQIMDTNSITPKIKTNHTIISYASLRDRRFKNH